MKISTPLPARALAWSESLNRESDLELRGEGYLHLAGKLAAEEHWPAAAEIYAELLSEAALPADIRREAETRLALLSGNGAFGQRVEHWTRGFLAHCTDPAALAAMTAGGLAYRLARLGVAGKLLQLSASPWTRGLAAKGLAVGAGFGAEISAFTALGRGLGPDRPSSWSQDLAHAALSLGALKLSGAAGNAVAGRILGIDAPRLWTYSLLQQSSLLGGIWLGGQLETALDWREGTLDSWEALATLLHFNIGGQLSRRWLGRRFAQMEGQLEQRWREMPWQGPTSREAVPAMAGAGNRLPLLSKFPEPTAPRFLSVRKGEELGLTPDKFRTLLRKYIALFPVGEQGLYSQDIVERSCLIRCTLPGFHENLLEALLEAPNRGQISQLYTVIAIERIFVTDALGSSRGSFAYAPLQLLLGQVLTESDAGFRQRAMRTILSIFERGFSRTDSTELLQNFTRHPPSPAVDLPTYDARFHTQHGGEAARAWANYRPQDRVPLFNFVHRDAGSLASGAGRTIEVLGRGRSLDSPYFASEIEAALDYARLHPYGDLVLSRLFHILEVSDLPSKLNEITGEPSKIPTNRYVEALSLNGRPAHQIAVTLNGSVHTAHFNDMRLAEKVVSVFQEIAPYLKEPKLREKNKARLIEAFLDHAAAHRRVNAEDLFRFLGLGHYSPARFFEQAWRDRRFQVSILSDRDFYREVEAWGRVQDCEWTFYRQNQGSGGLDQILIRELPELRIGRPADRDHSFSELVWRLRGLVHELEHWRHFRGHGAEGPMKPFRLVEISREDRLITEIMAYLEEFRWRTMNTDEHFLQIARRLGDTLPLFFRNVAELSYF